MRGEDGGPPERAQRNFTDPDSRILPTRDGFVQGYNGQIAVDAAHQVIVAHRLVTTSADYRALVPLVDSIHAHLGRKPRERLSADYALEYGTATLEVHTDSISPGQRVLLVDDVLATGGTLAATVSLVEALGGVVVAVSVVIELAGLAGRQQLAPHTVHALWTT